MEVDALSSRTASIWAIVLETPVVLCPGVSILKSNELLVVSAQPPFSNPSPVHSTDKESGYNLDEKAEIAGDSNMAVAPEAKAKSESAPEKVGDQNLAEAPGKEGDIDYSVDKENGYNLDESDEVKKN